MKHRNTFVYFAILISVYGEFSFANTHRRQIQQLVELIETLNSLYTFDNIIFYRTPKLHQSPVEQTMQRLNATHIYSNIDDAVTEYMISSHSNKPIMTFSIEPWDYVNDTDSIPNLGKILTNKNLGVVVLNDIFNTELKEFVSTSLGASLETKLVFLLIGGELTDVVPFIRLEKLKRFFRWCWSKNMLEVILLFQKYSFETDNNDDMYLEVYTYTPFPKPIKLIQLTNRHPKEYFKDRTLDLEGYEFKTPVCNDKPNVFKAFDPHLGTEYVTGISGHLYVEFVKKINGKFTELKGDQKSHTRTEYQNNLLIAQNIDIGIHPFSYIIPTDYYGSYPISNTNSCVVVPVVREIFPGLYIPLTLNLSMWLLLITMFLIFQIAYFVIDIYSFGRWSMWDTISITLRGMLNMPLGHYITFSPVSSKRKLFIYMLVILSGMIFSTIHTAALTSFFSTTIYGSQLETIDDLRRHNVSIMLLDYLYYTYNYLDLIPSDFESNLVITDVDTVSRHLNALNSSYAYIVYNEEWKVMQDWQRNLWKPRFKIAPKLCIANVYLSLPMQFNSPFYHPLQNFILKVQETGLELKWTDDILWDIHQTTSGRSSLSENEQHPAPLTLVHFTAVWCVYGVGMSFASLVFLYEKFVITLKK